MIGMPGFTAEKSVYRTTRRYPKCPLNVGPNAEIVPMGEVNCNPCDVVCEEWCDNQGGGMRSNDDGSCSCMF